MKPGVQPPSEHPHGLPDAEFDVMDVIDRTPGLGRRAAVLRQRMVDKRAEHHAYVRLTGDDLPEIRDWTWPTA